MAGWNLLISDPKNLDLCQRSGTSHICNVNLGIARNEMPQLNDDTLKDFFNMMSANGAKTEFTDLDPFILWPMQNQLNAGIVEKMERTGFDPFKGRPIFVHYNLTNHFQIVDGHH